MQPKLKKRSRQTAGREDGLYCSRSQAVRRLGLRISDFRRLCILKGVFPRVPKTSLKGRDKVYYYLKDIRHLAHEPILEKFRELRIITRRLRKAMAKQDKTKASHIDQDRQLALELDLSHILKERYPSMVDALRDMDDALSLVALFASSPARNKDTIEGGALKECRALIDQWMLFTSELGLVNKCFASIKGWYYEVEILGQKIVWLMPHEFSNAKTENIDFKVMGTFLLLYRRLVKFVMYKLYLMAGLKYPPKPKAVDGSADLAAGRFLSLEVEHKEDGSAQLEVAGEDGEVVKLIPDSVEAIRKRALFSKQVVYLARETPIFHLAYMLKSAGVKQLGWDEVVANQTLSPIDAKDESITHHIIDRPTNAFDKLKNTLPSSAVTSRSFVQPQWILDSLNVGELLPLNPFAVGELCPPHLSPFGDSLGHVPEQQRVLEKWRMTDDAETVEATPAVQEAEEVEEAEKDRARLMLSSKKRRLYKKLRSQEEIKERAAETLSKKARKTTSD